MRDSVEKHNVSDTVSTGGTCLPLSVCSDPNGFCRVLWVYVRISLKLISQQSLNREDHVMTLHVARNVQVTLMGVAIASQSRLVAKVFAGQSSTLRGIGLAWPTTCPPHNVADQCSCWPIHKRRDLFLMFTLDPNDPTGGLVSSGFSLVWQTCCCLGPPYSMRLCMDLIQGNRSLFHDPYNDVNETVCAYMQCIKCMD